MPRNLSEHFTLEEMIVSEAAARKAIDNTPGPEEIQSLTDLCVSMLEPIRQMVGSPLIVTSGYRCKALNSLVGGAPNSQHMVGQAADILCPRLSQQDLFQLIRESKLPFDQLIDEFGSWVHVSYKRSGENHCEILCARNVDGITKYTGI